MLAIAVNAVCQQVSTLSFELKFFQSKLVMQLVDEQPKFTMLLRWRNDSFALRSGTQPDSLLQLW